MRELTLQEMEEVAGGYDWAGALVDIAGAAVVGGVVLLLAPAAGTAFAVGLAGAVAITGLHAGVVILYGSLCC